MRGRRSCRAGVSHADDPPPRRQPQHGPVLRCEPTGRPAGRVERDPGWERIGRGRSGSGTRARTYVDTQQRQALLTRVQTVASSWLSGGRRIIGTCSHSLINRSTRESRAGIAERLRGRGGITSAMLPPRSKTLCNVGCRRDAPSSIAAECSSSMPPRPPRFAWRMKSTAIPGR
jgi:hypothetical protein